MCVCVCVLLMLSNVFNIFPYTLARAHTHIRYTDTHRSRRNTPVILITKIKEFGTTDIELFNIFGVFNLHTEAF